MLALALLLLGCASPPPTPDAVAATGGLTADWVDGQGFRHRTYRNAAKDDPRRPLHVYLEGDGLPFRTPTRINADPTPRNPLALRLMLRDPAPAVYVGRPCYHGEAAAPGCSPVRWTTGRYAEPVVASMAAALRRLAGPERPLVLIGYSGGGVFAMLLAARLESVVRVVSIAANLDIDRWAALHGYTPLATSLNPAAAPPLPARIQQLHLAGADDRQVPPWLSAPLAARQPAAEHRVLAGFDHRCCWESAWPALMGGDGASAGLF
jgi:hypothetical protein